MPASNAATSVTLDRNGLSRLVISNRAPLEKSRDETHNSPTLLESVDMEEALKAEHCEDSRNDMQLCADAHGSAVMINVLHAIWSVFRRPLLFLCGILLSDLFVGDASIRRGRTDADRGAVGSML